MNKDAVKFEKSNLAADIREMNDYLRTNNKFKMMTDLASPSSTQTLLVVTYNWVWVLAVTSLVYFHSVWWAPLALLVIGSRQRALVVLTHEASHYLLAKNRKTNDLIANIFLCFPMLKSLKYYRAVHLPHHKYLGDDKHDTDYLNDPEAMKKGWFNLYLKYLFCHEFWIISELKQTFKKISAKHLICITLWWISILVILAGVVSLRFAETFASLWFLSRAIAYHIITTFIIISDHHGLFPGSIIEYTRNHPSKGLTRWFIHPHNNGFHLTHHLMPSVPFYNLDKARKLLKGWSRYDKAEQCENYFLGKNSVVRSWNKFNSYGTHSHETAVDNLQCVLESFGVDSPATTEIYHAQTKQA